MFGILNHNETEDLLEKQSYGRLGCYANGKTYIVPLNYVYHEHLIYCHSYEGMKIDMMRKNPKVCFEVESTNENEKWETAIAWGTFEEIIDEGKRKAALELIMRHPAHFNHSKTIKMELGKSFPFMPVDLNDIQGIVFAIHIEEETGRFEKIDSWSYEIVHH